MSEKESSDFYRGFYYGYQAGQASKTFPVDTPNISYPFITHQPCKVCGIVWDKPMSYVCYHEKCPTKVTC
jgi:hypothetical protein